jgi:hypothetical protein
MSEPQRPFPSAAAGALVPVRDQVEDVKQQALEGTLRIDIDAARAILTQLAALRARAAELVGGCTALDTPLRFGDNWVGHIVSERLRKVAVDQHGGVTPVMTTFNQVLTDLEATVRFAAGLYETTDEQVAEDLKRAAGQFGVEVEETR